MNQMRAHFERVFARKKFRGKISFHDMVGIPMSRASDSLAKSIKQSTSVDKNRYKHARLDTRKGEASDRRLNKVFPLDGS